MSQVLPPEEQKIEGEIDQVIGFPVRQGGLQTCKIRRAAVVESDDFAAFGRWLGTSGLPAAAILEGGYSPDLPQLIDVFLSAWEKAS